MAQPGDSTRWTIIRGAAAGREEDRKEFARRYAGVIRAYLGARWRDHPMRSELDDATQDVFVECFKEEGALARAAPSKPGRFRTFLYAVVRNVARRAEQRVGRSRERQQAGSDAFERLEARDEPLSKAFDRAWALAILERAGRLQAERARAAGAEAERRREILDLRFRKQLPIREIAARWGEEPARVHRAYARAREEFRAALRDVVREEEDLSAADAEVECARLLGCLQ